MFHLMDLLEAITGKRPEQASLVLPEAVIDSRQVIPGAMFIALPGEKVDGHDYVQDAFDRGARLAVIQQKAMGDLSVIDLSSGRLPKPLIIPDAPFCIQVADGLKTLQETARIVRSHSKLKVIGITGSVGKSTTKEVVSEVLAQRFHTLKNPGNLNNEIGLPLTLLKIGRGHERAVLEMGFYVPGEIKFLCELSKPEIGVVTNIGTVHAERAGSQATIARGKAELVKALPPAPVGVAILNHDDPWVNKMAKETRARVLFYGLDPQSDLWADEIISLGLEGITFHLHYQGETLHMKVPLIGRHSVHTALRAIAVGLVEGLTWHEIVSGLTSDQPQLRLVAVHTASGALVMDDTYNASPESTLAALNLLGDLDGRKIAVLGDMLELGQYERHGHEMVGSRAAEIADKLITLGVRGRIIARAALQSGLKKDCVSSFDTTDEVIGYLQKTLKSEDVVLVKGSHGMHMERIVAALEVNS
ncbi:MAG: UDP-N-acetylmuramoyl-tripeptide--D-alanyl-D-alanine ligase [Anaerolineaceae bacterium]|nr:UDP-N-acetylmuramoyl-tripeptide--D-alanyl-D-alanine ligase [Anaerolineaceae bacterium]MBN2676458.1 UDP-N-acetylmuramoyl-tripeptide--D-alanyl-D-alanine ligase [Anaerolineaceae bacterium]